MKPPSSTIDTITQHAPEVNSNHKTEIEVLKLFYFIFKLLLLYFKLNEQVL